MAEELELNLEEDNNEEIISRKDSRIKSLSDKVKEKAQEAEARAKELEEASKARAEAEKERDFFKSFNKVSSKYQGASEYQEKIWEKVRGGYDIEDAAVAVLNKEGKFNPPAPKLEPAAGGSASIGIAGVADKSVREMSQDERRAALQEMEAKGDFRL